MTPPSQARPPGAGTGPPGRVLKRRVLSLLTAEDWPQAAGGLRQWPARRVINPLFGLFHHPREIVRWRAVSAMGAVTADLAGHDRESARVVMRRLMWTLNDESGGIGWGSPEAMGEIMARSAPLADEFACILISYIWPEGNYLELPALQQGVLWGLGRLGRVRPERVRGAADYLPPFLGAGEAALCGLAVWASWGMTDASLGTCLARLQHDSRSFTLYRDARLETCRIGELAAATLGRRTPAAPSDRT